MAKNSQDKEQRLADLCLIEAAHTYAYKDWREDSICGIAYNAFKAGAEWQRNYEREKKGEL